MKNKNTKIIFFGTPEIGATVLGSLIENNFDVVAVVAQPDKKIGRKQEIEYSPAKKTALENRIKIFQPENLKDEKVVDELKKLDPGLFVVAAYGKILPKGLLEIPKFGAINVHPSLLPKFRGPTPVPAAILASEKETGVTLILMDEKMDEGDILAQEKMKIRSDETADQLMERLAEMGAAMVGPAIEKWVAGGISAVPQDGAKASYCQIIRREDGKIDWSEPAEKIYNKWRAFQPWPGIFTFFPDKNNTKRMKLVEINIIPGTNAAQTVGEVIKYREKIAVQAENGLIILKKIQLEGKKEMMADDFLKGRPDFIGKILA
ncbi:MAG: methionyl-tRNA formyltransferase [Candidatus Moranbacteria bacterium]|nr:methionyl-tRNA formyltransferase [Candidatus Moranbacteria bacterium]